MKAHAKAIEAAASRYSAGSRAPILRDSACPISRSGAKSTASPCAACAARPPSICAQPGARFRTSPSTTTPTSRNSSSCGRAIRRGRRQAGGKLTVTAIALKVCASALKVFPQFNASIDMAKEEIVYKQYINIGVAVDTDRGLLVPVVRDVDKKNIVELAAELAQTAKKAREQEAHARGDGRRHLHHHQPGRNGRHRISRRS